MRVAIVAPFVAAIDERRPQIGGAQAVIADLARGLAARGHAVTLIAPRGSRIDGVRLVDLGIDPDPRAALRPDAASAASSQTAAFAAVGAWLDQRVASFDVVHSHAFDAPAFARIRGATVIHTLHLPPMDAAIVAAARTAAARLATVSKACAAAWTAAGVAVTDLLPNGVDLSSIAAGDGAGGYVAFAGRMSPEKGAAVACRIARGAGLRLRIAGPVYDATYFERDVRPLLSNEIEYVGPLDRPALWRMLGGAAATVLPIRWEEPFGMVALESLACGTPVVGYRRGGLPEVVSDGRSGRLAPADDEAALAAALDDAQAMDRSACRADAARFDLPRMLDAHESLYRRVAQAA